MFRVLIVEDDVPTSKQLKSIITEQIEDVQAHTAMDVPEARALIETAKTNNQPYHAVVLDLMLPRERGIQAELDESLCNRIRQVMPHTLVAHITIHDKNGEVKKHLEVAHDKEIDRSFRLSKAETDYATQLVERLRPFLYGLRIEQQIDDLFNGGGGTGYPVMSLRTRDSVGDRSKTHELAALTRDISNHWESLDEGLRTRIKDIFNITVEGDEITVSLF